MRRLPFTLVGAAGVAGGYAGMVAMLPGAAAGVLGAIGISGSSALARTLSPVAEPLFIISALLVIMGALACSRLVVVFAVGGSTLLYLSMFQLASSAARSVGSMSAMSMQQPRNSSAPHADATTFYLGVMLLMTAVALTAWRRRRHECRPLVRLPRLAVR